MHVGLSLTLTSLSAVSRLLVSKGFSDKDDGWTTSLDEYITEWKSTVPAGKYLLKQKRLSLEHETMYEHEKDIKKQKVKEKSYL